MQNKFLIRLIALAAMAAAFLLLPTTASMQAAGAIVSVTNVDTVAFPEVTARVSVIDGNGNPIRNLAAKDFIINEDSNPVQIRSADSTVTAGNPASVCLALDINGSTINTSAVTGNAIISETKRLALSFVNLMQPNPNDEVCLIAFGGSVDPNASIAAGSPKEKEFSKNKPDIAQMINVTLQPVSERGKPLYDGALKAIKTAATRPAGARAVLLITEGRDELLLPDLTTVKQGSDTEASRTIGAAKEAHIPVYTIAIGNDPDTTFLKRLAEASGGENLDFKFDKTPEAISDFYDKKLPAFYDKILSRLRTQYTIKYFSALPSDGKTHNLQVRVKTIAGEAETLTPYPVPLVPVNLLLEVAKYGAVALLLIFLIAILFVALRRKSAPPTVATMRGGMSQTMPGATPTPYAPHPIQPADEHITQLPPVGYGPTAPPPGGRDTEAMPGGHDAGGPPAKQTMLLRPQAASVAFLVMERGDHPGKDFVLHGESTTIGRAGTNDIVVDDGTVSRQQAKIKQEGKAFYLYDMAATNPTLVNGKAVKGRARIEENDRIEMGKTTFVFKQVKR